MFGERTWRVQPPLDDLLIMHACAFCWPQIDRLLHQNDSLEDLQAGSHPCACA